MNPWIFRGAAALFVALASLVWLSGSPHGTWTFECTVGVIGYDLAHGLNPRWPLLDYFDSWTSGYLVAGAALAPLTWVIPTAWALKLLALATALGVAWLGRRAAVATLGETAAPAALLLLFGPPMLSYYSLHAGDYHYTELFGVLLTWLAVVEHLRGRWPAWFAGLCAGLALLLSWGSVAALIAILLAAVLARPGVVRRLPAALLCAAVVAAPLPYKLLVHRPWGVQQPQDRYGVPYLAGGELVSKVTRKLLELPRGVAQNLGWGDVLWSGFDLAVGLALGLAFLLGLGFGLRAAARAARSFGTLDDEGVAELMAWVPASAAAATMGVWLLMPFDFPVLPPEQAQLRDARYLPPVLGLLTLNLGFVLVRLRAAPAIGLFAALGAAGLAAMVQPSGLGEPGLSYRGRCYDTLGVFASRQMPITDRSGWHRPELCAGFPEEGRVPCQRGRVWGSGPAGLLGGFVDARKESHRARLRSAIETCQQLPDGYTADCVRFHGWAMNWHATGAKKAPALLMEPRCAVLEGESRGLCRQGTGVWFADHLLAWPQRLDLIVPPSLPQAVREDYARGVGYYLHHTYRRRRTAEAQCRRLPFGVQACLDELAEAVAGDERRWPPPPIP